MRCNLQANLIFNAERFYGELSFEYKPEYSVQLLKTERAHEQVEILPN